MSGRVVIVTGTSGGIGSAIAAEFEALGDTVVGLDIVEGFDVTDPDQCRAVAARVDDVHGGIDVLCNNAGIGAVGDVTQATVDGSERRLGAALASLPRESLNVSTKVGRLLVADDADGAEDTIFADVPAVHPVFDFSADGVQRSLEASLDRLGLDRVDIVHVHDPDDHAEEALAGAFPALRRWRDAGVVGAIGAGMNQAPMLARFVREAGVDCVLLAGRYTLLDQSGLDELLPLCAREGVSVIAAGVFNSGLLADPSPGAPFNYAPAATEVVERARELASVCARHDVPLTAAALQFAGAHPAVTCVLTGVRSVAELRSNMADFTRPIPRELWTDLRAEGLLDHRVPTP